MGFLRRALSGAARSTARGTGRFLSNHVLPDTLIPSWETQRRISKAGTTISRSFSGSKKLKKKQYQKPTRQYQSSALNRTGSARPGLTARPPRPAYVPSARPQWVDTETGELLNHPPLYRGTYLPQPRPATRKEPARHDANAWNQGRVLRPPVDYGPRPPDYMKPARRDLMNGPASVRAAKNQQAKASVKPRGSYRQGELLSFADQVDMARHAPGMFNMIQEMQTKRPY